jgi:hypothetical protein
MNLTGQVQTILSSTSIGQERAFVEGIRLQLFTPIGGIAQLIAVD